MPMPKFVDIRVPLDPARAWCWTRNGDPAIQAIHLSGEATLFIEGVNRRGQVLGKSGFRMPVESMDALAHAWLNQRGENLTPRGHAAILAGLRLLQVRVERNALPDDIAEIWTNGDAFQGLSSGGIEELCMQLNAAQAILIEGRDQ